MSINEIWQVRGNEWAWVMPNYCTLLDAAYLVLGEEPTSPGADHPGRVYKALSEMKTAIINNQGEYPYPYINYNLTPFIRRDTPPESIKVSANFVRKWAERYKITDFFEASNPVNNQNESLLGQITAAEQLADNDKEFFRVIDQWIYDFWIEKGRPKTSVFFRMLKKTMGEKGSPVERHWGAGLKDGGFHWKAGSLEDDMTYKTLGNKVSGFKKLVNPPK